MKFEPDIYGHIDAGFALPGPVLIPLTVRSSSSTQDPTGTLQSRVRDSLGREQTLGCRTFTIPSQTLSLDTECFVIPQALTREDTYSVTVQWTTDGGHSGTLGGTFVIQAGSATPGGGGAPAACNDHIDNDNDTFVDLNDPGCFGDPTRTTEGDVTLPPGRLLAVGVAMDGQNNVVPAKITLTLSEPGGLIGSRTSTTGRVEFPINVSSGVTVQTDLFCPAETATHRLVGVPKNAQGGLGTVSGNVLRATCTYELKPGQVLGSIRGFVRSEVDNPLDNVDVGVNSRPGRLWILERFN